MLTGFGDSQKSVQEAASDASHAMMAHLSSHGVRLVVPLVLKSLDDPNWRIKVAYCY